MKWTAVDTAFGVTAEMSERASRVLPLLLEATTEKVWLEGYRARMTAWSALARNVDVANSAPSTNLKFCWFWGAGASRNCVANTDVLRARVCPLLPSPVVITCNYDSLFEFA